MARRKNEFALSTQTSLVDTFTCAIGVLLISILVAGTAAKDPKLIPAEEIVFTCRGDPQSEPNFFRTGEDAARGLSKDEFAQALARFRRDDRLSFRVTVGVAPGRTNCSRNAQDVVRDLNVRLSSPETDDDRTRPFLVLDLVRTPPETGAAP